MLDARKIDAAVSAVERFKSRVDRYADAVGTPETYDKKAKKLRKQIEQGVGISAASREKDIKYLEDQIRHAEEMAAALRKRQQGRSDAEEQQESKSRSKETTHNKETRQTKDGEKHVVETKQTSEPQQDDPPDPEAKAASGESKAAVNALKTKIAQDKKEERYAQRDDAMKPDPNMSAEKMDKMVSTTEKLVKRMDAYDARNRSDAEITVAKAKQMVKDGYWEVEYGELKPGGRVEFINHQSSGAKKRFQIRLADSVRGDDYGHPIASGFRTQEQERRSDDTVTQEEKNIHHTITKHQQDERAEDDEEEDAEGGDQPRKDAKKK
jgi:hypothetical protein